MLNKQGPGKIDWCDDTWNPIAGKCHHNCSYCYMHRFWRLRDNAKHLLKKNYLSDRMPENPSKIFVGSSTDMWGEWVDEEWIHQVLAIPDKHPEHTYQFLTKNPSRYDDFYCWDMKNCWFGTTDDGTPQTKNNIRDLIISVDYPAIITFASFEPLLAEITSPHLSLHMKF